MLAQFPCGTSPCIDPIFGSTQASAYWSSTTDANDPSVAWFVVFGSGIVLNDSKIFNGFARAVRGGR